MHTMNPTKQPDLSRLTSADLVPIEVLMAPDWPEVWRDLARSAYISMVSYPALSDGIEIDYAALAVEIARGIARDLGGTQPYIPVGVAVDHRANETKVMELLRQGQSYKAAADACGITENRARHIERAHRKSRAQLRAATP